MTAKRKLSTKKKVIFCVAAIVLPLFLLESFSRIIWFAFIYERPSDEQVMESVFWEKAGENPIPYRLVKNSDGIIGSSPAHVNNLGLRGQDITQEPLKGVRRIMCLGDSVTFGFCVTGDNQTYPYQLGDLLKGKTTKIEVLNAGFPGFESQHLKNYYNYELHKFKPDLVIIQVGWNDLVNNVLEYEPTTAEKLSTALEGHVYTYKLLLHLCKVAGITQKIEMSRRGSRKPAILDETGYEKYRIAMTSLIESIRRSGATPFICTLPHFYNNLDSDEALSKAYTFRPYGTEEQILAATEKLNELIRSIAKQDGVPLIDLSSINQHTSFADFCHPNDTGSKRMADIVAEQLPVH